MYVAFNCFTDYNVSYMTKRADNYVAPFVEIINLSMESGTLIQSWGIEDDDLGSNSTQLTRLGWDPDNEEEF